MMDHLAPIPSGASDIAAILAASEAVAPQPHAREAGPAEPRAEEDGFDESDMPSELEGGEMPPGRVDLVAVKECAALDHSDTDNGRRMIAHFGADLAVFQRSGVRNSDYLVWTGTHWDIETGNDAAFALAQKVGALIALEADFLSALPHEIRAMRDGDAAGIDFAALEARRDGWSDADKILARDLSRKVEAGKEARAALDKRKVARRKFGVSSKNKARLDAMLTCAAPMLTKPPAAFNADPLRVATRTHTLVFSRVADPECPDEHSERFIGHMQAVPEHIRTDLITQIIPVAYDPEATCPKFDAFTGRFLPVAPVRRFVQVYSGLSLLGLVIQKFVFHYGEGANGKSVFMQTLANVFGALGSTLSPDAITGTNQRQGGQASPELARLYGKRFVRVSELPEGVPLQEELVKRLSGGEEIPVRNLFQGLFDFKALFKAHMSGNGYPKIEGNNHGIWRRMAVVHWPVTLAEDEQRNFDEVVDEFRPEHAGILNWLVEGAKIYLSEGLVVPEEVRAATKEYRDEMDPIGPFIEECVEPVEDGHVTAREMYLAYRSWADANSVSPIFETRFGKLMKARFRREDGRIRRYVGCRLHDVPGPPLDARNPYDDFDR